MAGNVFWVDVKKSWFHPSKRLIASRADVDEHLAAMQVFTRDPMNRDMNDWIVTNLDTLDRKAQGQLLLTTVVLAIAAVLYSDIARDLGRWGIAAITVVMAALIFACVALAVLNVVYWTCTSEFRNAGPRFNNPPAPPTGDEQDLFSHLLLIRETRTRIIWLCGLIDVICLTSIFCILVAESLKLGHAF
jgi:hypothetical protein